MGDEPAASVEVTLTVNGERHDLEVPARKLLVHVLHDLGLRGSRIGCETSSCGCCTVLLDDERVKSCTVLAFQADGREVTTIEGLADEDGTLTAVQDAFSRNHALQCGYCTAGMVMAATSLLRETPDPSRDEIKQGIAGNLCRCTGYTFIVDAIEEAAESSAAAEAD